MDVPLNFTWTGLLQLAQNRVGWRQRVHSIKHGSAVEITINGDLPQLPPSRSSVHSKTTAALEPRPPPPSPSTLMARKYRQRDAHAIFFRPSDGKNKRKRGRQPQRKRKRNSSKPWTRKQKEEFARRHEALQTEFGTPPTADRPWPYERRVRYTERIQQLHRDIDNDLPDNHKIFGHGTVDSSASQLDTTIPITPPPFKDMCAYLANISTDHENLRNLSLPAFDLSPI